MTTSRERTAQFILDELKLMPDDFEPKWPYKISGFTSIRLEWMARWSAGSMQQLNWPKGIASVNSVSNNGKK